MALSTKSYLNLSALAYIDFDDSAKGKDIKHLVDDRMIKEDDLDNPGLSALKDSSNPLRSWILLDLTSTPSGFRGAAFQVSGKKIILGKLFYAYV